ncbi:uncharacterized protein G2W53_010641 [Senna tora]|uniref:Uncharacterized protein n=1 Tax=Senna tora TaxID=362788 RepID=A0A834X1D6_9FABA|nr:uncharacterized protein G2W53_010641 [Senna tora]
MASAYRMNRDLMFHSSPPVKVISALEDDFFGVGAIIRACVSFP